MKYFILLTSTSILLSSCYTYKIFPEEYKNVTYSGARQVAYILNPELRKEYKILQSSKIFELTYDSSDKSAIKIKLLPIKKGSACGQPLTASLLTLGQVPIYLPDTYEYTFDELKETETIGHRFEMRIATRIWFWDMFLLKKNFEQKAGQVLSVKYYSQSIGG